MRIGEASIISVGVRVVEIKGNKFLKKKTQTRCELHFKNIFQILFSTCSLTIPILKCILIPLFIEKNVLKKLLTKPQFQKSLSASVIFSHLPHKGTSVLKNKREMAR